MISRAYGRNCVEGRNISGPERDGKLILALQGLEQVILGRLTGLIPGLICNPRPMDDVTFPVQCPLGAERAA